MAEIFPDNINDFPEVTEGEERIFKILKSDLLPQGEFYSWYEPKIKTRNQNVLRPDFIVWSNKSGLIVLEIKDWDISGISEWNDASVMFKNGSSKKNPERQSIDYVNSIMSELKKRRELINNTKDHKGNLKFPCSYGIVLTNITRKEFETFYKNKSDLVKFLFSEDIFKIEAGDYNIMIKFFDNLKLFKFDTLNDIETDLIRQIIFPRIIIRQAETKIDVLDKQQEQEAFKIGPGHRIIKGVAGSGKTLILAYRTKILKSVYPNYRILIICYNITLKKYIRTLLDKILPDYKTDLINITVDHFHNYAYNTIRNQIVNGRNILQNIGQQKDWQEYQRQLGDLLIKGMNSGDIHPEMYDAILIDECQDLTTDYLKFLVYLLNKNSNHLLIAIDPAQNLYGGRIAWNQLGIQAKGRVKTLKRTYRNTKQILNFAIKFNPDSVERLSIDDTDCPLFPDLADRNGNYPEVNGFNTENDIINFIISKIQSTNVSNYNRYAITFQSNRIIQYFDSLINKLAEQNIPFKKVLTKEDKEDFDYNDNCVKIMGIHNIKGYEFDTVFLIGVENIRIYSNEMRNLLYVGITRAMTNLVIPYININSPGNYLKKMINISTELRNVL